MSSYGYQGYISERSNGIGCDVFFSMSLHWWDIWLKMIISFYVMRNIDF